MDKFMHSAMEEAIKGRDEGGIPIGSVLVRGGQILSRGRNRRVQADDPIMHAEIDCLQRAGRIGSYADTTLYSTLMPCYLCAGAAVQFGIKRVIVGEAATFIGASEFMREHGVKVDDLDMLECKTLMQEFIKKHPDLWSEDIGGL